MKNAWILGIAVCVGLAALLLVGYGRTVDDGSAESAAAASRGGLATGAGGRRDADGAPGRNNPGGGSAGSNAGGSRGGSDGPSSLRRNGAAAPAREAGRVGGANVVASDGGGSSDRVAVGSVGETRLDLRPNTTRREVPEMGKQPASGGLDSMAAENEQPPPEPPPEVAYDGGPDKVFNTDWQVEVPDAGKISGEAGTVSFWLKPEWKSDSQDDATFVQLGDSGMQITKNVDYLRFEYIDANGTENGLGTNIGQWKPGDWHQVTTTWTNGNLALYVDGQLISQNRYTNPPTFGSDTRLYIGSNFPGTPVAPGQMSYVRVLNRDTPAGEVGDLFRSGPRPNN